jgi:DNA-binding Lrp family transcriptional regulator
MSTRMSESASHVRNDRQIIDLLRSDVRMTRRRMAESTGLPESTIRARLDRVLRSGAVRPTIFVHPAIERSGVVYMLHIEPASGIDIDTLLSTDELAGTPWAGQIATTGDLIIQQSAASVEELAIRLERVRRLAGVRAVWAVVVFRVYVGSSWPGAASVTASAPTRDVDQVDLRLIAALRRDGRTSYTDLATTAQLTVAATRRRVLRLVEDGLIRFAAVIEAEGSGQEASIDIDVAAGQMRSLIDDLCRRPFVRYVTEQSGRHNLACYVVAADSASLAAAVEEVRSDLRVRQAVASPIIRVRDVLSWDGSL